MNLLGGLKSRSADRRRQHLALGKMNSGDVEGKQKFMRGSTSIRTLSSMELGMLLYA